MSGVESVAQPPASEVSAPVAIGSVLAGKYRVDRVLGAGGMGVVVAATHLELEQTVALKFLLPGACETDEVAKRFVREARAATMIRSENVARVMDVGRLDNGSPYMVMEYLQGSDLAEVAKRGPLAAEFAVECVIQACDALAEAHAAGIIHRDLKPANLFLTQRADGSPLVKVLDFGISKLTVPSAADANLTRTSAIMGSPYYMSPEQMRSAREVDHRTDIWSLGVILFELIGGQPPFAGTSLPELIASIMTDRPGSLRALQPEVPPALEAIILRCLDKDCSQRFASVAELVNALGAFAPAHSHATVERISRVLAFASTASTFGPAGPPTAMPAVSTLGHGTGTAWSETSQVPRTTKGRSRGLVVGLVALGSLVLAGAGVTAYAWMTRHDTTASDTAAQSKMSPTVAPDAPVPAESSTPALPSASDANPSGAAELAGSAAPSEAPASALPEAKPQPGHRAAWRPSEPVKPVVPTPETAAPAPTPPPPPPPPVQPRPRGNPLDVGLK